MFNSRKVKLIGRKTIESVFQSVCNLTSLILYLVCRKRTIKRRFNVGTGQKADFLSRILYDIDMKLF